MSSPGDGVPLPWSASDARKETSAFKSLGVRRLAICGSIAGPVCAAATAAMKAAAARNTDLFIARLSFLTAD
jgi:hypothetical protein